MIESIVNGLNFKLTEEKQSYITIYQQERTTTTLLL